MPEDMNKQLPEENLEPEEILEPEENSELEPEENMTGETESSEIPKEESEEDSEESCEECEDLKEEDDLFDEDEEMDEEDEDLPEEILEEEPPVNGHKKKSWWMIILLAIIIISVFNTLWNKVESKLDNMNTQLTETVAAQTKTMDEMKAGFDELKTLSDEQEVRIKKAERYIASIKKSMKNFDTEVEGIQGTTSRHEEWLKKDLEAKKAELEKLTSVISELENILSGEKTSK